MELEEKQEIIRSNITRDVTIEMYVENDKPMISFNPKKCNRVFIDRNFLKLESLHFSNAGLFNLMAFNNIRVIDYDKCDNEDIKR